jgi:hypothetical protein
MSSSTAPIIDAVIVGMPLLPGDRVQTTGTELDVLSRAAVRLHTGHLAFLLRAGHDDGRPALDVVHVPARWCC